MVGSQALRIRDALLDFTMEFKALPPDSFLPVQLRCFQTFDNMFFFPLTYRHFSVIILGFISVAICVIGCSL